tara:strand:- start:178 stop:573 length:396 start_codon:yes stop_codon:yes gene_type:complete
LIAQSFFSQIGYPKLTIINNDTLILFTPSQAKKISITFLNLDKQILINKSLTEEISLRKEKDSISDLQIRNLLNQLTTHTQLLLETDIQFEICDQAYTVSSSKLIRFAKQRKFIFIGGISIGATFMYLILK